MIKFLRNGPYKLIETNKQTKILILDDKETFAWIDAGAIGEILIASHKKHDADHILATGAFRVYKVKNEPKLTDLLHLELHVGNCLWQGYLLPTGLPSSKNRRKRIIPTKEVITCVC